MRIAGAGTIRVVVRALALGFAGLISFDASAASSQYVVASEFTIGGGRYDRFTDLLVDPSGNTFVSGIVGSYRFPGIDPTKITNGGYGQRFVAKIPPLSKTAAFVAVVGDPASVPGFPVDDYPLADEAQGLALDSVGNAYLVAYESPSINWVVTGGPNVASTGKKYVYKVSSAGVVSKYSIALDPAVNRVAAIVIDGTGAIYLSGSAKEGLLTSPGAPYATSSVATGCIAPYVMKLDPTGQTVLWSTYLGQSGTPGQICGGNVNGQKIYQLVLHPTGFAIALDASGNVYVTGQAEPGLPATPGAVDLGTKALGPFSGNNLIQDPALHAFVTKLDPSGHIVWNARIGGSFRDRATSIVVDASGSAVIAGKTASPDFPRLGASAISGFGFVTMDCLLWTPEQGFLARLSPDGRQIVFSGGLPLDGNQFDDCSGSGYFNPAKLATDATGSIYVAGYTTPSNRDFDATPGAITPDPLGNTSANAGQVLQIYSADGQQKIYSSALAQTGVQGLGVDRWGGVVIASYSYLQRLAVGSLPVYITASPNPGCAGQTVTLSAQIAGSNDNGTVDFQIDGVSVGSASIANGVATKGASLAVGVRKLKAIYHGAGPFDGYPSFDLTFAVNQAGACQ